MEKSRRHVVNRLNVVHKIISVSDTSIMFKNLLQQKYAEALVRYNKPDLKYYR